MIRGLEKRGRACSVWIDDPLGRTGGAHQFREFFGPFAATVNDDLRGFAAGVAVAPAMGALFPPLNVP